MSFYRFVLILLVIILCPLNINAAKSPVKKVTTKKTKIVTKAKIKKAPVKPVLKKVNPAPAEPVKTASSLNTVLISSRYSVDPLEYKGESYIPSVKEKLLITGFQVQGDDISAVSEDKIKISASDKTNTWSDARILGFVIDKDKKQCDIQAAFVIPSTALVEKINVKINDQSSFVLDLSGKITGLDPLVVDSTDTTHATPLSVIFAIKGNLYPAGALKLRLDKLDYTVGPIAGRESAEDARFAVFTFTAVNQLQQSVKIDGSTLVTSFEDADAANVPVKIDPVSSTVDPGKEVSFRIYGQLANDNSAHTLSIKLGESGRQLIYDLGE